MKKSLAPKPKRGPEEDPVVPRSSASAPQAPQAPLASVAFPLSSSGVSVPSDVVSPAPALSAPLSDVSSTSSSSAPHPIIELQGRSLSSNAIDNLQASSAENVSESGVVVSTGLVLSSSIRGETLFPASTAAAAPSLSPLMPSLLGPKFSPSLPLTSASSKAVLAPLRTKQGGGNEQRGSSLSSSSSPTNKSTATRVTLQHLFPPGCYDDLREKMRMSESYSSSSSSNQSSSSSSSSSIVTILYAKVCVLALTKFVAAQSLAGRKLQLQWASSQASPSSRSAGAAPRLSSVPSLVSSLSVYMSLTCELPSLFRSAFEDLRGVSGPLINELSTSRLLLSLFETLKQQVITLFGFVSSSIRQAMIGASSSSASASDLEPSSSPTSHESSVVVPFPSESVLEFLKLQSVAEFVLLKPQCLPNPLSPLEVLRLLSLLSPSSAALQTASSASAIAASLHSPFVSLFLSPSGLSMSLSPRQRPNDIRDCIPSYAPVPLRFDAESTEQLMQAGGRANAYRHATRIGMLDREKRDARELRTRAKIKCGAKSLMAFCGEGTAPDEGSGSGGSSEAAAYTTNWKGPIYSQQGASVLDLLRQLSYLQDLSLSSHFNSPLGVVPPYDESTSYVASFVLPHVFGVLDDFNRWSSTTFASLYLRLQRDKNTAKPFTKEWLESICVLGNDARTIAKHGRDVASRFLPMSSLSSSSTRSASSPSSSSVSSASVFASVADLSLRRCASLELLCCRCGETAAELSSHASQRALESLVGRRFYMGDGMGGPAEGDSPGSHAQTTRGEGGENKAVAAAGAAGRAASQMVAAAGFRIRSMSFSSTPSLPSGGGESAAMPGRKSSLSIDGSFVNGSASTLKGAPLPDAGAVLVEAALAQFDGVRGADVAVGLAFTRVLETFIEWLNTNGCVVTVGGGRRLYRDMKTIVLWSEAFEEKRKKRDEKDGDTVSLREAEILDRVHAVVFVLTSSVEKHTISELDVEENKQLVSNLLSAQLCIDILPDLTVWLNLRSDKGKLGAANSGGEAINIVLSNRFARALG